jgi:hypothetical protein
MKQTADRRLILELYYQVEHFFNGACSSIITTCWSGSWSLPNISLKIFFCLQFYFYQKLRILFVNHFEKIIFLKKFQKVDRLWILKSRLYRFENCEHIWLAMLSIMKINFWWEVFYNFEWFQKIFKNLNKSKLKTTFFEIKIFSGDRNFNKSIIQINIKSSMVWTWKVQFAD